MNWNKITRYVIGFSIAALIAYDVIVIINSGREASISWQIIEHSYDYPMVPFLAGFLCGHLFWRMNDPRKDKK
jgi:hypothetical protein